MGQKFKELKESLKPWPAAAAAGIQQFGFPLKV